MSDIMNIFEELAESYTYNGVVSLKALEDDIVTLENQIDSYNATLRELQLRGKKPGLLVGKIRDAKIKLSLLKAVYKKESDKATPDDVILNILGVSAKNANEVQNVGTAADGRQPKPQNFESAELEIVVDETVDEKASMIEADGVENKDVTVVKEEKQEPDKKLMTNEKVEDQEVKVVNGNSIVVAEEDNATFQSGVLVEDDKDEVIVVDPNASEEELKDIFSKITSDDTIVVRDPAKIINPGKEKKEPEIKSVEVEVQEIKPDTEITETEKEKEESNMQTIKADDGNMDYSDSPSTDAKIEEQTPEIDGEIVTSETVHEKTVENVPPPTIDDYMEPETGSSYEKVTYDKDGVVYEAEDEPDLNEIPADTIYHHGETTVDFGGDIVASEQDEPAYDEVMAYDAFPETTTKIYASFDLSDYTNMVNTDSIKGFNDNKRKELHVTFCDLRDYPIYIQLVNERTHSNFFTRLFKKPKSIFMDVCDKVENVEVKHKFEFYGCRVKALFDSEYQSLWESNFYATDKHEFTAVFKYKKLKIE